MRNDINCPYCDSPQDINHDDGSGYQEDEMHQQECKSCDKIFGFTTYILYSYTPYKVDCFNGSDHNWHPTITTPKRYTKMRCTMCDEERPCTPEEIEMVLKGGNNG